MIHKINKKLGETPLEALERFRTSDEKLSYMGRLDPMAEGEILILSGEDNKNNEKYRKSDKEYLATFLLGVSSDSGDLLGLIKDENSVFVDTLSIEEAVEKLKSIESQKFPWFSAKTYKGKKLFDHFKEGNLSIERSIKNIQIKEVEILEISKISAKELKEYIFKTIPLVNGDFRQKEILNEWQKFFDKKGENSFETVKIRLKVSSGTYIRGLTEELEKSIGIPVILMKLKRTKIFLEE